MYVLHGDLGSQHEGNVLWGIKSIVHAFSREKCFIGIGEFIIVHASVLKKGPVGTR